MKKKEDKKNVESVTTLAEELEKSKPYIEMYDKAYNFDNTRFEAYAELMAFYQGNQHLLKKYKTERPWVVNMNTPYATVAVENRVASILVNDYKGDLLPLSPEDIEIIEPLDRAYKREWERMNIDDIIKESVRTMAVVREAYCHIIVNDKKVFGGRKNKRMGAMEAEMIEPSRILIDPTARNLKDANYCIVLGRISKKDAIQKYSKIKDLKEETSPGTPAARGEIYYDNDYNTSQEDVFDVWNIYIKENGKIKKIKLINCIIVKESFIDIDVFPIAQIRWNKAAQSCYGISLMDQLLSLQKAVNAIESAITNTAIAYAAPSMMVAKGSGVDPKIVAKSNGAPGIVYSVNGNLDNAIKPVVPPKIQDEILAIKQDFELKIREISGNSNQFMGNIGTAANTVGGAEVAVERAKIIEVNILNNIKEYVEDIVNIIVKFIIKMYPGAELYYATGRDGNNLYTFDNIKMPSKKDLKDLEYKFFIELDKKTQYSQDKQKQELMDLFQFERQYDVPVKTITVPDIIKNSDLVNKEEIIARYNNENFASAEEKANTIQTLVQVSESLQIPQELVTQAISELLAGGNEHPALDELMGAVEQGFQAQLDSANEQADMGAVSEADAASMQDPTAGLDPEAVAEAEDILGSGQVPTM